MASPQQVKGSENNFLMLLAFALSGYLSPNITHGKQYAPSVLGEQHNQKYDAKHAYWKDLPLVLGKW